MSNLIYAADLFCGGGGTSQGLARACERLKRPVDLVAVNHWPTAVATHERNHPWARHYCASLEQLHPRRAVPGGRLDIIVAGVECIHHSRARGGRPMSDQSRASAWHVLHWCEALHVREVLIENVPEFREWAPLDDGGRPIKAKKGTIFDAYVAAFQALGYTVDHRILVAANFGDPTTRKRLFFRASLDGEIKWPEPTHDRRSAHGRKPWRTAREIIEWNDLGESIFTRKKPLAPRTVERIAEGIRRFCGPLAEPFLVTLYGTGGARTVDAPVPTVTGGGQHIGLAQPFMVRIDNAGSTQAPRSVDQPVGTIVGKAGIALAQPFLVPYHSEHTGETPRTHSVDEPVPTVTTENRFALAQAFLLQVTHGDKPHAPRTVDEPLTTVTGKNGFALASAFLVPPDGPMRHEEVAAPRTVDLPFPTVRAERGGGHVVTPFLLQANQGNKPGARANSVDEPLGTVVAKNHLALLAPFLLPHDVFKATHGVNLVRVDQSGGHSVPRDVDAPVPTVGASRGLGLAVPFLLRHDQFVEKNGALVDSVHDPLHTVKARAGAAGQLVTAFVIPHFGERPGDGSLVTPFVILYYGNTAPDSVEDPLAAVTSRDHMALVSPEVLAAADCYLFDIRFRMLNHRELARAQGFPVDFEFAGTRTEVVRQIGNAVPVGTAEHLCYAALAS